MSGDKNQGPATGLVVLFVHHIMNTSHHPGGAPDVFQKLVTAVNEKREYTEANERVADSWRKSNRRHQQLEMEGLQ